MKTALKVFLIILAIAALWVLNERTHVLQLHDFVEYWASGRLNITGGNPYDPNQMFEMEKSAGLIDNTAILMWNPPWMMPFSMLFGIFPYSVSRFLWFLIQMVIVSFCGLTLWNIYNGKKRYEWIALLLLFTFGPMLHTLKSGQSTLLVLFGGVGFLYFIRKGSDYYAGILASLAMIKPHLLYLFLLAVVIWSLSQRRYKVLIGMALAVVISIGVSWLINPRLLSEYIFALRTYPPENWRTATLGALLRIIFGTDRFYLQFVPSLLGFAWFLFFWLKHKAEWDWITVLPLIVLVSMATASYGWAFDVAICIWGIIQIATLFTLKSWTIQKILIFITYWIANLINIILVVDQSWFLWLSSFLLIWYILSFRYLSTTHKAMPADGALVTT